MAATSPAFVKNFAQAPGLAGDADAVTLVTKIKPIAKLRIALMNLP